MKLFPGNCDYIFRTSIKFLHDKYECHMEFIFIIIIMINIHKEYNVYKFTHKITAKFTYTCLYTEKDIILLLKKQLFSLFATNIVHGIIKSLIEMLNSLEFRIEFE